MDLSVIKAVGFVHLHVHSAYSLREGALTVEMLAKLAQADAMPALAITDTNNLFGALEFSEKLAKSGVQPIIGAQMAIDFADAAPAFWRGVERDNARAPIVLLAQSETGYQHLMRLATALWLDPKDGTRCLKPQNHPQGRISPRTAAASSPRPKAARASALARARDGSSSVPGPATFDDIYKRGPPTAASASAGRPVPASPDCPRAGSCLRMFGAERLSRIARPVRRRPGVRESPCARNRSARLSRLVAVRGCSRPTFSRGSPARARRAGAPRQGRPGLRSNYREVVEARRGVRMLGAERLLAIASARSLKGRAPPKSLLGLQQYREIVEAYGGVGMLGADAFSRIASARS